MTNTEQMHLSIMKKHSNSMNGDNNSIVIIENGNRERKSSERSEKKRVRFAIDLRKRFHDMVNTVTMVRAWNRKTVPQDLGQDLVPKPSLISLLKTSAFYVIDPGKAFYYRWLMVISLAVLYNYIFIIGRTSFDLLQSENPTLWYFLDYLCDFIYLIDIAIRFRTGYLEQGLIVSDSKKLALNYVKSFKFKLDCLSIIPIDIILLFLPKSKPISRINRLIKLDRLLEFRSKSETTTTSPYLLRIVFLFIFVLLFIHLNACFYFLIGKSSIPTSFWVFNASDPNLFVDYIDCIHWSTLMLSTVGEVPNATTNEETLILIVEFIIAIIIFASVVGNIGAMIENITQEREEFQRKVDSVKSYLRLRKVKTELEKRVIKRFDYLWKNQQRQDGDEVLKIFPTKLRNEICIDVYLKLIKNVAIFSDCEEGFLKELTTKLKPKVYSPGDYVCRKGDIGKEMYIIKRGDLNVVSDDGNTVFVTLKQGAYFGEISILNIAGNKNGNRRTANVVSVGFSDLLSLSKNDLWDTLSDYTQTKKSLLNKGREKLIKDNLIEESYLNLNYNNDNEKLFEHLNEQEKIEVVEQTFENLSKIVENLFGDMNKTMLELMSFLENGQLVKDTRKLVNNHIYKPIFYLTNIVPLIPVELLLAPFLGIIPILRLNRLLKINRLFEFRQITETITNYPNIFRLISLFVMIMVFIFWDACFYFMISKYVGFDTDEWTLQLKTDDHKQLLGKLTYCLYWASKAITSIINLKPAEIPVEQIFIVLNLLISLLVFAALVGNITSIISNLDAQRSSFQQKVDSIKSYMKMRLVNKELQRKVLKWFEYSWSNSQGLDEEQVKSFLPENLQTEISMSIHFDTLKQVHIFQDCEPGLLQELVNKLVLQVFSPGDYICRKGDIGREMYFVKRGVLHVVSDDGQTVFAKLKEGSYFGEISILNIQGNKTGNRRTANVVSVGYSDLFCLTKDELWRALVEYPVAKQTLIDKGKALLRKDNLIDESFDINSEIQNEIKRQNEMRLVNLKSDLEELSFRASRFMGTYKANLIKIKKRLNKLK